MLLRYTIASGPGAGDLETIETALAAAETGHLVPKKVAASSKLNVVLGEKRLTDRTVNVL